MPTPDDLRAVGDRIESLLQELEASLDRPAWERVQDLVTLVSDLYGGGLARILELVGDDPSLRDRLAADDLVASLLVVHDLHPRGVQERVGAALDSIRPVLAAEGGDVELVSVDAAEGVVRLRLRGSPDGCASAPATLEAHVRRAIEEQAPEIARIDVDRPDAPPAAAVPVVIGRKTATERPARSAP